MDSDARVVRGANLAALVFAIMSFVTALAITASVGAMFASFSDVDTVKAMLESSSSSSSAFDGSSSSTYSSSDYEDAVAMLDSMSDEELQAALDMTSGVLLVFAIGYFIMKAVAIYAAVQGIRVMQNPQRIGRAYGWAIAAAIVSLLTGALISCALFIISVVYLGRMRKAFAANGVYGQPQPPYGQTPCGQPYNQAQPPYGNQPQQPV